MAIVSIYTRCGLLVLLLTWSAALAHGQQMPSTLVPGGQTAEAPSDPTADETQLRRLIETIEDPAKRDELLASLRALLAAQKTTGTAPEAAPDDALAAAANVVADGTGAVREIALGIVDAIERLPLFVTWLQSEWRDPSRRGLWTEVGVSCLVAFGLGIVAHFLVLRALAPTRRRLAIGATRGALARAVRVPVRLIVDLLPVLAFALAAYFVLALIQPEGIARTVVRNLIGAAVVGEAAVALIRRVFSPDVPELRALAISDAAAHYGAQWGGRVIRTAIYGYALLEAAVRLGLHPAIHELLLHVLFFAVAALVALVIIAVRCPVRAAIDSLAEERRSPLLHWLPWGAIASIWHVVALAYLAFVCLVWTLGIPGGFQALIVKTLASGAIVLGAALVSSAMGRLPHHQAPAFDPAPIESSLIERRLLRYRYWLALVGRGLVLLIAGFALLELWGVSVLRSLSSRTGETVLGHLVTVALVAIVTLALWEAISLAIERSVTKRDAAGNLRLGGRTRTLLNIARNFVLVFLGLIAVFLVLAELGINIAPLLAGAGVIGLAIGFGSQKLVQDIITGIFVLFGDTMRVGDVVEVAGRAGVVEAVTMRTVVLRDERGKVHTIPYSAIDTVTNLTKEFSYAVFDIGISYRENVDDVMQVLRDLGAEIRQDPYFRRLIMEPLEVLGLDRFADSAVVLKARFKTRPLRQWEVAREFNRRIKNRFDQLGIEIPFPHQTVYFGADKQGQAPAAHVEVRYADMTAGEQGTGSEPAQPKPHLAQSTGD
jgi:moderate conductance mechanosensitive channel